MKYAVITFTQEGDKIAQTLALTLNIDLFSKKNGSNFNFKEVSKKVMENYKGIIFIGFYRHCSESYSAIHKK